MIHLALSNRHPAFACDESRLCAAAELVLAGAGIRAGEISLAIVDDATIHDLNRRFLGHDFPTDVLSFPLELGPGRVDGEIVASADTALREARRHGWSAHDELLWYVIHGALHLAGYDDADGDARAAMRAREREYLAHFGAPPPPERG